MLSAANGFSLALGTSAGAARLLHPHAPVRLLWNIGGRRHRLTSRQKRALLLLIVVFPVNFLLQLVLSVKISGEGSLTTAVCWFTETFPDELTAGSRQTSQHVDSVQAFQPPMELRLHPMTFKVSDQFSLHL